MNCHHYYVIQNGYGWAIQCEGENSDPFATRAEALRRALDLVHLDDRCGRAADVVVLDDDNRFRRLWISDPPCPQA
jgi:hypothetical protein